MICTIHTKLDLHMVGTFAAVVKAYFSQKTALAQDCLLPCCKDVRSQKCVSSDPSA